LESTTDNIASEIRINAEHHLFNGHFPGAPVTPGVIQLQMIKTVFGKAYGEGITTEISQDL
jgi:3-hydroxyacyl-[acyl-carrier-protein] dehydratase